MPEASMDKHDCSEFWEDQIGPAWHYFAMEPISQASGMKRFSQHDFGFRIPPFDPRHHSGTRRPIDYIGHHEFPWLVASVLVCD